MIADAQTKYIMGKIDENGWKQEIENWANAGGTKIREEYAEDYKNRLNKRADAEGIDEGNLAVHTGTNGRSVYGKLPQSSAVPHLAL